MDIGVGDILTGTVTGITKFGAFVTVAPGKSGLVHISEIAGTYVSDVREHLSDGQEVTVKVLGFDNAGRLNLSIKAAAKPAVQRTPDRTRFAQARHEPAAPQGEPSFEDKLKRFMQDSDSKMSDLKQYLPQKGRRKK